MSKALDSQRTYALIGTGGCGKTSLAEMLLFQSGVINRLGAIEEGTTTLDYEPEEIKRRGSIQPGFATFLWNKDRHFLMDVPGDTNFTGDLPYLLMGVDAAVLVIDAVDGVRPLTRRIWNAVREAGLPSFVFINKMDRDRADFDMAFNGLSSVLGMKPVTLYMPVMTDGVFTGRRGHPRRQGPYVRRKRRRDRSPHPRRHRGRSGAPARHHRRKHRRVRRRADGEIP